MPTHSRSGNFWRFQIVFWGLAGMALFISGITQMPLLQAAVRNLFLFIAGFLASFFLAMVIDQLRGLDAIRLRVLANSAAYVLALFCVVSINTITFTMRGVALPDITFGQWFSGTMNLALVFFFWSELFIQQVYVVAQSQGDIPPLEKLTVETGGSLLPLSLDKVMKISAAGDYVEIHTQDKTYIDRTTLQALETRLSNSRFLRVHRSLLVNKDWIQSITPLGKGRHRLELKNGQHVDSSRGYHDSLRKHLL